jgi:hypothetical protein
MGKAIILTLKAIIEALSGLDRADMIILQSELDNKLSINGGNKKKVDHPFKIAYKLKGKIYTLFGSANGLNRQVVALAQSKLVGASSKDACRYTTGRKTANFKDDREFRKILNVLVGTGAEILYDKSKLPVKEAVKKA